GLPDGFDSDSGACPGRGQVARRATRAREGDVSGSVARAAPRGDRIRPRSALGRQLRSRGLCGGDRARRMHLGKHRWRPDPDWRAAAGDRSDDGLRTAHHDARRRIGTLPLPDRRQAHDRAATRRVTWNVTDWKVTDWKVTAT